MAMNPAAMSPHCQYRPIVFIPEPRDETRSLDLLRPVADVCLGDGRPKYTEAALIEAMHDVDAVIISSREGISRRIIEHCGRLKIIAKRGAKPSNVDLQAATEKGIPVTWTPGSNAISVAEHAMMMILVQIKKFVPSMQAQKRGKWRGDLIPGNELCGKTVGIIGFGQTGSELAKRLAGFAVEILVYDPYVPGGQTDALNVRRVNLDQLLRVSDIVTLHCDLNEQTRHIIGVSTLARMKRTACIVNTARGGLIDTKALYAALDKGLIAGAALDVFEDEPTQPDEPLFALENVVHTPHMAGITHESVAREPVWAAEEVVRVLKGEPPLHVVNPDYARQGRGIK
jgi:D-3-phosphoglycerate dehydrogenase